MKELFSNDCAQAIELDGSSLNIEETAAVARYGKTACLCPQALKKIEAARIMLEKLIKEKRVVYGITTGFGRFSDVLISGEDVFKLQNNLIASHAAAVGEPLPAEVVRGAMLLRVNALAKGHSGVRPLLARQLLEMLNRGVTPVVPGQGSLGASGDLAPLAHIALVVTGQGEAIFQGERLSGAQALLSAGLQPLVLMEKEGLALINGTQVMSALGCLALFDALNLLKAAQIISALTLEALLGVPGAFDPLISAVRSHPGQAAVAADIRRLLAGSRLFGSDRDKVQDAYSLRCIPQVHGATRDALTYVRRVLEIEINSATDNPLLFPEEGKVLSGGNFHGQPVAQALDFLAMAAAELAGISERRVERLVNPVLSGLPPFLINAGGLNSGFMIAQYTAASLVSENKVLCHPASVDSIPSSANQEDHVSMGATAARKARQVIDNVGRVLGLELLTAGQAVDFRGAQRLGEGTGAAHSALREKVDFIREDRILYPLINEAIELVTSGRLVAEVEKVIPLEL